MIGNLPSNRAKRKPVTLHRYLFQTWVFPPINTSCIYKEGLPMYEKSTCVACSLTGDLRRR